jgi:hypothetical protein
MLRTARLACAIAALALNAACPAGEAGTIPSEVVSANGGFRLALQSQPAPMPLNQLFEIHVTVDASAARDDSDNPVWLRASAEMPAHKHGMNTRVVVDQLADGQFLIKGLLFHMRGEWLITFDVAKGRVYEQASVRVVL